MITGCISLPVIINYNPERIVDGLFYLKCAAVFSGKIHGFLFIAILVSV